MPPTHGASRGAPVPVTMAPGRLARFAVALLIGAAMGAFVWATLEVQPTRPWAGDFSWPWRGARALLDGADPYAVLGHTSPTVWPFNFPLYHPATTLVVLAPFALLTPIAAGATFFGLSSALLAYAVTAESWRRLPLFVSPAFLYASLMVQFSPLLTAAAASGALAWLWIVKPNIGLAALAAQRTRRAAVAALGVGVLIGVVSLILMPGWPAVWLASVRDAPQYAAPLLTTGGPILLLAALRWRRPEARLLLAMACVPSSPIIYETLPLSLVPRSTREAWVVCALGWATYATILLRGPYTSTVDLTRASGPVLLWGLYVPCLILVLSRPNAPEPAPSTAPLGNASPTLPTPASSC